MRVFWKASKGSNADGLPPALFVPLVSFTAADGGKLAPISGTACKLNLNFAQIIFKILKCLLHRKEGRAGVVVKALRYKPAGRSFDSRWCNWNFSVT